MGRSISGFTVDRTKGAFGPFQDQLFLGDFSLSLVLRATTEEVNGVWQGACYPFREGLATGLLDVEFTPAGNLLCGGTNRGWPVRGTRPFALQRIDFTGEHPLRNRADHHHPRGLPPPLHPPRRPHDRHRPRDLPARHLHPPLPRRLRRPRDRPDHPPSPARPPSARTPARSSSSSTPTARATCTSSTSPPCVPRPARAWCTRSRSTR